MSKERVSFLHSAVHILLLKDGSVLLLRRFKTGWQDGNYSIVAGHLDGDETVTETMIREAKEEADLVFNEKDLKVVHTMHRKAKNGREYIDFFFTADRWDGEPRIMEHDKCDDLQWFPLAELPSNTLKYIRHAIANYQAGIPFSEFGWRDGEAE